MKRYFLFGPDVVEKSTVDDELVKLRATVKDRDARILGLRTENAALKLRKQAERPVIDPLLGDPTPKDTTERKMYVAGVAGFYHDYFERKLMSMLGEVRMQLEKFDSTLSSDGTRIHGYTPQEFDLILKGTANALWLLHDWGEQMRNEHVAYVNPSINGEERELLNEIAS